MFLEFFYFSDVIKKNWYKMENKANFTFVFVKMHEKCNIFFSSFFMSRTGLGRVNFCFLAESSTS